MTGKSIQTRAVPDTGGSQALPYMMVVVAALIIASNHVLARYVGGVIPPLAWCSGDVWSVPCSCCLSPCRV